MSINIVKGVEFGLGFEQTRRFGSGVHDVIEGRDDAGRWVHRTNNAGGLTGGITNGEPIVVRGAVKPISTLARPLPSADLVTGEAVDKAHYERSDISVVPAAGVIGEAMVLLTLAALRPREVRRRLDGRRQGEPGRISRAARSAPIRAPVPGHPARPDRHRRGRLRRGRLTGDGRRARRAARERQERRRAAAGAASGATVRRPRRAHRAAAGRTIPEIFADEGEDAFRAPRASGRRRTSDRPIRTRRSTASSRPAAARSSIRATAGRSTAAGRRSGSTAAPRSWPSACDGRRASGLSSSRATRSAPSATSPPQRARFYAAADSRVDRASPRSRTSSRRDRGAADERSDRRGTTLLRADTAIGRLVHRRRHRRGRARDALTELEARRAMLVSEPGAWEAFGLGVATALRGGRLDGRDDPAAARRGRQAAVGRRGRGTRPRPPAGRAVASRSSPSAAAPSATRPGSSPRRTCAAYRSSTCRRRWSPRSTRRSAARPASTCPRARTSSAPSTSRSRRSSMSQRSRPCPNASGGPRSARRQDGGPRRRAPVRAAGDGWAGDRDRR